MQTELPGPKGFERFVFLLDQFLASPAFALWLTKSAALTYKQEKSFKATNQTSQWWEAWSMKQWPHLHGSHGLHYIDPCDVPYGIMFTSLALRCGYSLGHKFPICHICCEVDLFAVSAAASVVPLVQCALANIMHKQEGRCGEVRRCFRMRWCNE